MTPLKTSGDRASWLSAVAEQIMDGGDTPSSIEYLCIVIPSRIVTNQNDGHVTAAAAFGEASRDDYRAGQRVIISEMVDLLREQGFVAGDDKTLRWAKPLNGTWQVNVGDRSFTVRGQLERRLSRDRNVLGERDEEGTGNQIDGMLLQGKHHPFEVDVVGARGGVTRRSLQVHPFALAIPPMTEREREVIRASIEKDGVKVPLVIFQDKVLDGRNRLYWASILKKPVRIEEFTGTEDEARRYVAILNLHRRHLSTAQQYTTAIALFGEKAREQTKEAHKKGTSLGGQGHGKSVPKTAQTSEPEPGPKWHEIVAHEARAAGLNVTPSGIRAMKEVMDAPATLAKVERGEIKQVAAAHKAALEEKKLPPPTTFQGVSVGSVHKRLGQCIEHLNAILKDCEMPYDTAPPDQISGRINQIEALVPQVREALRARKVIS